ncbi:olfactory receptor 11A1-like [Chanos chanos]|uniref:Olfactory receptor 11A1-like n=1 Tax=Chanos chanos TaxID=29144 RepID=A0A6J2VPR2_CHACN|nr:olfactory receptor 11A1-like [Chanos chanos]
MGNATQFMSIILLGYTDVGPMRYFYFSGLTLLYLIILFSNALLIGVISIEKTLHEPMYIFLCSLSLNELYGSTALFPSLLVHVISNISEVSLTFCFIQIFCLYTYALLEYCNLAVMSYDRYVSICYPFHYSKIITHHKVFVFILLSWLFCFIQYGFTIFLSARLQLCDNVIEKVYCDNYLLVRLACSNTDVNNIYGLFFTVFSLGIPLLLILYSYMKILKICWNSNRETKRKAMSTCTPHIASLLNFSLGCSFEIFQSRFVKVPMPNVLRVVISVYFVICPPLLSPVMYGIRMSKIRKERRQKTSITMLLQMLSQEKPHGWSDEIEVLFTIYWLACGASYRATSDILRVPVATVCRIVHNVVEEKMNILHRVIHFSKAEELEVAGAGFLDPSTTAYISGDPGLYKAARYDLRRSIRDAKKNYRNKVESNYYSSDPRSMWSGFCCIADYKGKNSIAPRRAHLLHLV